MSLQEAYKVLPDGERELPRSVRDLVARRREVLKSGRGGYVRMSVRQAELLIEDFKSLRERLAMCRNDLARATLGKPLPKYGRVAQFRVARKAPEASKKPAQPTVAPKWAKVLEGLK